MKKRSKISEVDIFAGSTKKKEVKEAKNKPKKSETYITKSFTLPPEMADKLKYYADKIAPAHIKVSESELLRFMIQNFNLEKARKNFFNTE